MTAYSFIGSNPSGKFPSAGPALEPACQYLRFAGCGNSVCSLVLASETCRRKSAPAVAHRLSKTPIGASRRQGSWRDLWRQG